MSRTRIAPTLRRAILEPPWDPSGGPYQASVAELRALLAVVSAADGVERLVLREGYAGLETPADKILFRALARLRSLSSPPSRRPKVKR